MNHPKTAPLDADVALPNGSASTRQAYLVARLLVLGLVISATLDAAPRQGTAEFAGQQQAPSTSEANNEVTDMTEKSANEKKPTITLKGAFDVKISPQAADTGHDDSGIGRMLLDKTYHGPLTAHSLGQMLAFRSAVQGSAGYVAMERVTGTLEGRSGSFVLQHSGTMDKGSQHLDLHVVPDSGTEELTGLSGTMKILIEEGGKHFYEFELTLP